MSPVLSQSLRLGERVAPKTILAWAGAMVTVLITGCIFMTTALAGTPSLRYLIPYVLVFLGILVVSMLGGIFYLAVKDPTKLQLGQVSGREYIANRKLTIGDSDIGERHVFRPLPDEVAALQEAGGLTAITAGDSVEKGESGA